MLEIESSTPIRKPIKTVVVGNNREYFSPVDKFIRPNLHGLTYSQLKQILSEIMYPINGKKEGVIITESVRSKFGRGKFGYLIFGSGQERTKQLEETLEIKIKKM